MPEFEGDVMLSKWTLAVLAVACIAAAGAGGYFASRQNAVPVPASAAAVVTPADNASLAGSPVEETEAVVGEPEPAAIAPTPTAAPVRPRSTASAARPSPPSTRRDARSDAPPA